MNQLALQSLAPRVRKLSESLREPIVPGDVNEKEREGELGR